MPKPNFFIIGAPKCGTTSLASWLGAHPCVFMAPTKEVNYWNSDHRLPGRLSLASYESIFRNAVEPVIGEGSVWYLYSRKAVPDILEYNRDARFIVCLRDPVEMAFSLHHQQRFNGNEEIADFRDAWAAQDARRHGQPVRAFESAHLLYSDICRLGEQVERLLRHRRRVHFVFLDDMKREPRATFNRVLDFLELPPAAIALRPQNGARERRSEALQSLERSLGSLRRRLPIKGGFGILRKLRDWNSRPASWRPDPDMAEQTRAYFRSDVKLLARLTGRPLTDWAEEAPLAASRYLATGS